MREFRQPVATSQIEPGSLIAWPVRRVGYHQIHEPKLVVEVRPVPEADWTSDDRAAATKPLYLTVADPDGRNELHYWVGGESHFSVLGEHYDVCARCGQLSPCLDRIIESETLFQRHALENQCCVCRRHLGWRRGEVTVQTPDGPTVQRYHTVKGSPCRRAYTLAVARDSEALARLRAEDEGRPYFPAKNPTGEVTS